MIVYSDFPEQWPTLLAQIETNLSSGDTKRVIGGLSAMRMIARRYEYTDKVRIPQWTRKEKMFVKCSRILAPNATKVYETNRTEAFVFSPNTLYPIHTKRRRSACRYCT